MTKRISIIIFMLAFIMNVSAQKRKVQNRPYCDLRPFHFGIMVGTHMQDIEFRNVGPITVTDENGNAEESFVTCDQDRLDPGLNVGVIGEFRLTENFQLRIAPSIYFGSRHFVFHNQDPAIKTEERQDLKSAYVMTTADLIFSAPRCNNHRAYMFAGISPSLNLTSKSNDFIKLKTFQPYMEVGMGFDEYLPYFKCRPELKFMFGLGNMLDSNHPAKLRDKKMKTYASCVDRATTKLITLNLYFE